MQVEAEREFNYTSEIAQCDLTGSEEKAKCLENIDHKIRLIWKGKMLACESMEDDAAQTKCLSMVCNSQHIPIANKLRCFDLF